MLKNLYPIGFFTVCCALAWEIIAVPRQAGPATAALVREQLQPLHDSAALVLKALPGELSRTDKLLEDTNNTVRDLNGTLNIIRHASAEERAELSVTNGKAGLAMDALVATAQHLDGVAVEARDRTLPALTATVTDLDGLVSDIRPTAVASTALVNEASGAAGELHLAISTANGLLADPELRGITHNLNLMSANGNVVAGNLALVTMDVHNMLNPKKQTFWEALATTGARSVLGAAAGPVISHFWPLSVNVTNAPAKP